jgi:hypothetical protein
MFLERLVPPFKSGRTATVGRWRMNRKKLSELAQTRSKGLRIDYIQEIEKLAPEKHRKDRIKHYKKLESACSSKETYEDLLNLIHICQLIWSLRSIGKEQRQQFERAKYENDAYHEHREKVEKLIHQFIRDIQKYERYVERVDRPSLYNSIKIKEEPREWVRYWDPYKTKGREKTPFKDFIYMSLYLKLKEVGLRSVYASMTNILYYYLDINVETDSVKTVVKRLKKDEALIHQINLIEGGMPPPKVID